jgi:SOS-response transcriptional repressor LexA
MDTGFGLRLRSRRQELGLTQGALEQVSNVGQGTISKIERGDQEQSVHTPKLADALGVYATWLATGEGPKLLPDLNASVVATVTAAGTLDPSNLRAAPAFRGRVPVISAVQAGHLTEVVDNFSPGDADEWIDVGVPVNRHTFALIVEGDSMEPEFSAGMRIVVEPDIPAEIGDFVVAGNGEQATLKKLIRDGNDLYLKPLNPRYPIKPLGDAKIIGVVREAHRKYR